MDRMEHLDPLALAAFQEGGLTSGERASAEAHLAVCAACRDRLGAQIRAAAGREAEGEEGRRAGGGFAGAIRPDREMRRELLVAAAFGAVLVGAGLWWAADRAAPARAAAAGRR